MTIRRKLMLMFVGLALFAAVVSAVSIRSLWELNDHFAAYAQGILARGRVLDELRHAADERAIAVRNLVLLAEPDQLRAENTRVAEAHQRVATSLARLKQLVGQAADATQAERSLLGDIEKTEQAYAPVALAIVDLATQGDKAQAIAKMNGECRFLLAQLSQGAKKYFELVRQRTGETLDAGAATYAVRRNVLVATCLLAAGLAVVMGWLVTQGIVRPIAVAVKLAERVSQGDLTTRIEVRGRDEVASLLQALQRMSQNLSQIVGRVRLSSDVIATGSAEIAAGNADLSHRTEQQASALQTTAATMEQLGGTVRNNADHARQADQLAAGAAAVAAKGGDAVNRVVVTMQGINESSRRIGDIIKVIDGIAVQTNLLALNAAVEAARAGDQGRGFAVVAGEVRSLARRSAEAAKEITQLIGDSITQVAQGSSQVDEAGQTMSEVVSAIQRVAAIVGDITRASAEQSAGMLQVGESVTQMDTVTQRNAALVEQSAAAAEGLSLQARQLVEAVSLFKTSPGTAAA